MRRQHDNGENCNRNGVPVEQADMAAHIEVGEKRHRKIPLCVNRNAARDVARSCTEKNREKKVGKNENEIPISLPKAIIDVSADFERDTAQNQTPQNQKEGEIVTGKSRSQQAREDRVTVANDLAVTVARVKQSVDQPRLPAELGRHPTERVGDVGIRKRQHQNPKQQTTRVESSTPIL